MPKVPVPLRKRIRALLKERGLSQAVVCDLTKLSPSFLSRLLTGKRRLSTTYVDVIARALDLSPEALVEGTDGVEFVQPNGASIDRETYEAVAERLAEATSRVHELEAEIAGLRDTKANQEAAIADLKAKASDAVRRAEDAELRVEPLARQRGRLEIEKNEAIARADSASSLVAETERRVRSLEAALQKAQRQIVVNYDAYAQAEARAQALAQKLGEAREKTAGAALLAGIIGLGLGASRS